MPFQMSLVRLLIKMQFNETLLQIAYPWSLSRNGPPARPYGEQAGRPRVGGEVQYQTDFDEEKWFKKMKKWGIRPFDGSGYKYEKLI